MKKANEQASQVCDLASAGKNVACVSGTTDGFMRMLGAVRACRRRTHGEVTTREKFVAGNLVVQFYKLDGEGAGSITMVCTTTRLRSQDVCRDWDDAEDWLLDTSPNSKMGIDLIFVEDTDG